MKILKKILDDGLSLLYPKICLSCGNNIRSYEEAICLTCQYKLPKTNFHLEKENTMAELFWGRANIRHAASFYYFDKGGLVRNLIHNLKYGNKPEIGLRLGQLYGKTLRTSSFFQEIEVIIPVPLHPKKQKMRGYNQSIQFAKGISKTMQVPWSEVLSRTVMTETQTQKARIERFKNVEHAFKVITPDMAKGKHVLLVDDVLTTGATLEACAHKLLELSNTKVSVATIAYAQHNT